MIRIRLIIFIAVAILGLGLYIWQRNKQEAVQGPKTPSDSRQSNTVIEPTDGFLKRVTLKPFGIYVTPQNSPVNPEHFTGYHTGADSEYGDVESDVEVKAIAFGEVIISRTAQGYGGVVIIRHTINNQQILVLYGHLRPSSMLTSGSKVKQNDKIAVLGNSFSVETDNERKHLHLGVLKGDQPDLRGYVQNQSELSAWLNPVMFIRDHQ